VARPLGALLDDVRVAAPEVLTNGVLLSADNQVDVLGGDHMEDVLDDEVQDRPAPEGLEKQRSIAGVLAGGEDDGFASRSRS
jgi:hypothetical protein